MTDRHWILTAALLALTAVSAGAFGAHALSDRVSPDRLETFRLAARYQFWHALALLVLVALDRHLSERARHRAQSVLLAGTAVFSGSLYLLVLTDTSWWGAVTPIGGVLLHIGWFLVAWAAFRRQPNSP